MMSGWSRVLLLAVMAAVAAAEGLPDCRCDRSGASDTTYHGCYINGLNGGNQLGGFNVMTVTSVEDCKSFCNTISMQYALLMYGNTCKCTNADYTTYGESSDCTETCSGGSGLCGGFAVGGGEYPAPTSVYSSGYVPPEITIS